MPEEQLYLSEGTATRERIASELAAAATEIERGTVDLGAGDEGRTFEVPAEATFEVELERVTDSETGEAYYELEYELSWTR